MNRNLLLALVAILVAAAMLTGCDGRHAVSKKTRDTVLLVYIDRSSSICSYSDGGLKGIQCSYKTVAEKYIRPIMLARDGVQVEIRAFVRQDVVLVSKKVDIWEKIRGSLNGEIKKAPYPQSETNKTLFSELIRGLNYRCQSERGKDFYVLILSDGHPDESFEDIAAASAGFGAYKLTNMRCLLIAPVAPDMNRRWREKMTEAVNLMGPDVFVSNATDYQPAVERVKEALGGAK